MGSEPSAPRRWWRSDEGSASVLMLAVAATLVVLAVALGLLAQATVGRARAQSVADLSAIAAARAAQRSSVVGVAGAEPCGLAAQVARHNGGTLTGCAESDGATVTVTATVPTPVGPARATARAAPRPP